MKALGPTFRRDAPAVEDPRATRYEGPDAGTARLFVWRRGRVRPASLGPLVLQEPELPAAPAEKPADPPPDTPPDNPSDRADWIARQLEADGFHFARPGTGCR